MPEPKMNYNLYVKSGKDRSVVIPCWAIVLKGGEIVRSESGKPMLFINKGSAARVKLRSHKLVSVEVRVRFRR